MLSIQMKPVLRIAVPVLLLWMHFSLATCDANDVLNKTYKTYPIAAESTTTEHSKVSDESKLVAGLPLQKNATSQFPVHKNQKMHQIKKLDENSDLPTVRSVPMEKAATTEQPKEMEVEISKIDAPIAEIGPRITLDSLPICGEGLKLFGNNCRKEA